MTDPDLWDVVEEEILGEPGRHVTQRELAACKDLRFSILSIQKDSREISRQFKQKGAVTRIRVQKCLKFEGCGPSPFQGEQISRGPLE